VYIVIDDDETTRGNTTIADTPNDIRLREIEASAPSPFQDCGCAWIAAQKSLYPKWDTTVKVGKRYPVDVGLRDILTLAPAGGNTKDAWFTDRILDALLATEPSIDSMQYVDSLNIQCEWHADGRIHDKMRFEAGERAVAVYHLRKQHWIATEFSIGPEPQVVVYDSMNPYNQPPNQKVTTVLQKRSRGLPADDPASQPATITSLPSLQQGANANACGPIVTYLLTARLHGMDIARLKPNFDIAKTELLIRAQCARRMTVLLHNAWNYDSDETTLAKLLFEQAECPSPARFDSAFTPINGRRAPHHAASCSPTRSKDQPLGRELETDDNRSCSAVEEELDEDGTGEEADPESIKDMVNTTLLPQTLRDTLSLMSMEALELTLRIFLWLTSVQLYRSDPINTAIGLGTGPE
jgi:hypothetical protein